MTDAISFEFADIDLSLNFPAFPAPTLQTTVSSEGSLSQQPTLIVDTKSESSFDCEEASEKKDEAEQVNSNDVVKTGQTVYNIKTRRSEKSSKKFGSIISSIFNKKNSTTSRSDNKHATTARQPALVKTTSKLTVATSATSSTFSSIKSTHSSRTSNIAPLFRPLVEPSTTNRSLEHEHSISPLVSNTQQKKSSLSLSPPLSEPATPDEFKIENNNSSTPASHAFSAEEPSKHTQPASTSLHMVTESTTTPTLPPMIPVGSLFKHTQSPRSSPHDSLFSPLEPASASPAQTPPFTSPILDGSVPKTKEIFQAHYKLPSLHLKRSSSSSSVSKNDIKPKTPIISSESQFTSPSSVYTHSFTTSPSVSDDNSFLTSELSSVPKNTSSSLAAIVSTPANAANLHSTSSLSSAFSHPSHSDRTGFSQTHNSSTGYVADAFRLEFERLDSDFDKFYSKTGVNRTNVLRLTLLTFLRNQVGNVSASSDSTDSQSLGSLFTTENPKPHTDDKPSLECLALRTKTFQKWWCGLLECIKSHENPVSGPDHSAYLEAISGIMARFEWIELSCNKASNCNTPQNHCEQFDTNSRYSELSGSTSTLSSFNSYVAATTAAYASFLNTNGTTSPESSHNFGPNLATASTSLAFSVKDYETLLYETLAWILNKLALKTVPTSVSAFAGKVLAYSFFFASNIAEPLLYLLRVSPGLVDRITSVSFEKQENTQYGTTVNSMANSLATLEQAISQMRHLFPTHVSNLVGYTYSLTPRSKNATGPGNIPSTQYNGQKTAAFSGERRPKSKLNNTQFSRKSTTVNVFTNRPHNPKKLLDAGGDIYGPWVRRWTAFNSDVFHSFLKHYYTILSKIMTAKECNSAQKATLVNAATAPASRGGFSPNQNNGPSGLNGSRNTFYQEFKPNQLPCNVHLAAPGLIILHAYVLGGLDSVVHPPIRANPGSKLASPSTPLTADYQQPVLSPLNSSRGRNQNAPNLRVSALLA